MALGTHFSMFVNETFGYKGGLTVVHLVPNDGLHGGYPSPCFCKPRPCPSYSGRGDNINLVTDLIRYQM